MLYAQRDCAIASGVSPYLFWYMNVCIVCTGIVHPLSECIDPRSAHFAGELVPHTQPDVCSSSERPDRYGQRVWRYTVYAATVHLAIVV